MIRPQVRAREERKKVYTPPHPVVIEAELLSRRLRDYVKAAWPVVEPQSVFISGWHTDAVCDHLEAVSRGEIRKLVITIPFRTGKSACVSVMWPTWEWTRAPSISYLFLSYAQSLSERDAVKSRGLIDSQWYQDRWGDVFQMSSDQNAKRRYENTKKGYRIATSIDGLATGEGGNRVVFDDPHNMSEIHSDTVREGVITRWRETMVSRLNNPATDAFVLIMQRGHMRDLAGYMLAEETGWEHLCIPMEYERTRPVYVRLPDGTKFQQNVDAKEIKTSLGFVDPRSVEGESISPRRFTREVIEGLKMSLGSSAWSGQAQQRPTPAEGGIYKKANWRFYKLSGRTVQEFISDMRFEEMIQSWDLTFKDTSKADRVAGHVYGRKGADKYLLHRVCKRMDFVETVRQVITVTGLYPQALRKLVEDKANGPAVISMLRSKIPGLTPVEPEGSKEARAHTASIHQEAGNIYLPHPEECAWVNELMEILAGVPLGEWDDADALAQAMIYFGPIASPIRIDDTMVAVSAGVVMSADSPWATLGVE